MASPQKPDNPTGRWLVLLFSLTVLAAVLAAATGSLAAWRVAGVLAAATLCVTGAHWRQVLRR